MTDKAVVKMKVIKQEPDPIRVETDITGNSCLLLNGLEVVLVQVIKHAPEELQEDQLKMFYENTLERLKE